jgi:hypothetical protein
MELERDAAMEGLISGQMAQDDPSLKKWWADPGFREEALELLGLIDALNKAGDVSAEESSSDFDPARDTPGSVTLAAKLARSGEAAPAMPHLLDIRFTPWQRITLAAAAVLVVLAGLRWLPADTPVDQGPLMGEGLEVSAHLDWVPGDSITWVHVDGFVGEFVVEILDAHDNEIDTQRDLAASPWTPQVARSADWPRARFQVRISQYDSSGTHQGTVKNWVERLLEE